MLQVPDLRSFRTRLVGATLVAAALPLLLGGTLAWRSGGQAVSDRRLERVQAVAATVSACLDAGLLDAGEAAAGSGRAENLLSAVAEESGVAVRVLVLRPGWLATIDDAPGIPHPGAFEPVLSTGGGGAALADYLPSMADALLDGVVAAGPVEGRRVAGCAPLRDPWGEVVGLVRVDGPAGRSLWRLIFEGLAWLLGGGALLYGVYRGSSLLADHLLRSLDRLQIAARSLADGVLTEPIQVQGASSEVSQLAETMERARTTWLGRIERSTQGVLAARGDAERKDGERNTAVAAVADRAAGTRAGALRLIGMSRQGQPPEELTRTARTLLLDCERVHQMARIAAGQPGRQHAFSPERLMRQATELVREEAAAKDLDLRLVVPEGLPASVTGDAATLSDLVLLLLDNAVRYTERGSIAVRVVPVPADHRLAVLRFEVADTGPGIEDTRREHLLASSPDAGGLPATGLALAARLARDLGSELGIESQPGSGSRFWFTARFERAGKLEAVGAA